MTTSLIAVWDGWLCRSTWGVFLKHLVSSVPMVSPAVCVQGEPRGTLPFCSGSLPDASTTAQVTGEALKAHRGQKCACLDMCESELAGTAGRCKGAEVLWSVR